MLRLKTLWEEPHMRRLTENLEPADRRFYWKFVIGLYGFYGALMIFTAGMFVANHLSKNRALEPAVAEATSQRPPAAIEAPTPVGMRGDKMDVRRIFLLTNEREIAR
jgi:hypothetical protein